MTAQALTQCSSLRGRRVLIVEDEHLIALDLSEVLTEEGAEVMEPKTSVNAALAALTHERAPDVALLDVSLDDHESVFAVADELQQRRIPFVFYTGYRPADVSSRFTNVTYCEKPMDSYTLAAALGAALRAAPGSMTSSN
jgi:CheY-like chemotaxis protein